MSQCPRALKFIWPALDICTLGHCFPHCGRPKLWGGTASHDNITLSQQGMYCLSSPLPPSLLGGFAIQEWKWDVTTKYFFWGLNPFLPGSPHHTGVHHDSQHAADPCRRDLRDKLCAICGACCGHSNNSHATEERRRCCRCLRRIRWLHPPSIPSRHHPGAHPWRLPDVLKLSAEEGGGETHTEGTLYYLWRKNCLRKSKHLGLVKQCRKWRTS